MLRFAGGLHIVSGRIVVEAELDTGAAARRLRKDIAEVYGHQSDVVMVQGNGIRKGSRYVVRVVKDGEALARQTGLLDQRGRPVRGLPPAVVSGGGCDAVAAWRGAFLAHGSLTEPGRSSSLEVTCPGPEAALALVGVGPPARHPGQGPRGARRRPGRDPRRRRDRRAAHPARRPRVADGLGGAPDAPRGPRHRQPAGQLRRRQPAPLGPGRRGRGRPRRAGAGDPRRRGPRPPQAGRRTCGWSTSRPRLEELGQLHEPVLTKDAIAGRIRRLLAMADKRAEELGIPDTEASLTPEMLADEA